MIGVKRPIFRGPNSQGAVSSRVIILAANKNCVPTQRNPLENAGWFIPMTLSRVSFARFFKGGLLSTQQKPHEFLTV